MNRPLSRRRFVTRSALGGAVALASSLGIGAPAVGAVALSGVSGTVNAAEGLQLRTGASVRYRAIATLPYGTRLAIVGTSSDWFKASVQGKTGYVNSWYVTLVGTPSREIYRGNTDRKVIALTFDAGLDLGNTERILTTLEEYGVAASFGLTGTWIESYPDYAARIVDDGHQILNHTLNHASYTGDSDPSGPISPAKRLSQLEANEEVIRATTGATAKPYWRPPFGDRDAGVLRDVGTAGWSKTVLWTIDTMGWDGATPDQIFQKVTNEAGNGVIVLMHVGAASEDVEALDRIIQTLRGRGYAFGTVAQVIAPSNARRPSPPSLRLLRFDDAKVPVPRPGHARRSILADGRRRESGLLSNVMGDARGHRPNGSRPQPGAARRLPARRAAVAVRPIHRPARHGFDPAPIRAGG
jgi:peptidoglycan/xylan/chitin deacetylase (PgdA/CDA1 family)